MIRKPNREERLHLMKATNELFKLDSAIYSLLDICVTGIEDNFQTAYVGWDKEYNLFRIAFGKDLFDTCTDIELAKVLAHELYHILFLHIIFDIAELEGKDLDNLNIAQDAIINDCIPGLRSFDVTHNVYLDNRVKLKEINPNFDVKHTTSEEVYEYLMANREKFPKGKLTIDDHSKHDNSDSKQSEETKEAIEKLNAKKDKGSTPPVDDTNPENTNGEDSSKDVEVIGVVEGSAGLEKLSDAEMAEQLLASVIKRNAEKFMGSASAQVLRIVENIIKTEYDPKKLLALAVRKSLRGDVQYSWRRNSRKLGEGFKGKKTQETPKVLIVTDTSGSVDDDILAMVRYQHTVLASRYDIQSCWGDVSLEGHAKIKKGTNVNIEFKGGGGTDLNYYREIADKEQFDLIIVNTDGFIPKMLPDKYETQKIFCIYPDGREVKGYTNIHIKEAINAK